MSKRKYFKTLNQTGKLHTKLHTIGYEIYPKKINIDKNIIHKLIERGNTGSAIFNHNENRSRNDHKRKQANVRKSDKVLSSFCNDVNDFIDEEFPNLTPNKYVIIHSKNGCGRQAAHCDYLPDSN